MVSFLSSLSLGFFLSVLKSLGDGEVGRRFVWRFWIRYFGFFVLVYYL